MPFYRNRTTGALALAKAGSERDKELSAKDSGWARTADKSEDPKIASSDLTTTSD